MKSNATTSALSPNRERTSGALDPAARTSTPAANSPATTRDPTLPVAPVTSTGAVGRETSGRGFGAAAGVMHV